MLTQIFKSAWSVSLTRGNCGEHLFWKSRSVGPLLMASWCRWRMRDEGRSWETFQTLNGSANDSCLSWTGRNPESYSMRWASTENIAYLLRYAPWIIPSVFQPNIVILKSLHAKLKTRPPSLSPSLESDAYQGQMKIVGFGFSSVLREDSENDEHCPTRGR